VTGRTFRQARLRPFARGAVRHPGFQPSSPHWEISMRRVRFVCLACTLVPVLAGCSTLMKSGVRHATPLFQDMIQQVQQGDDIQLLREGLPALLILVDGLLVETPDNRPLLVLASQANMAFAMGFIEQEDPQRASRIYWKGKQYGMRALMQNRKFARALEKGESYPEACRTLTRRDLPALFWTANNWAGWLNLNLRDTKALFDQPKILALMQRALELDDTYYYGGPHLFFATYYANLPPIMGGSAEKSRKAFDEVARISGGRFLMADVFLAEYYAPLVLDEELFDTTLQRVLDTPPDVDPEIRVMNELAKERARRLLEKRDEMPW